MAQLRLLRRRLGTSAQTRGFACGARGRSSSAAWPCAALPRRRDHDDDLLTVAADLVAALALVAASVGL